MNKTVVAAFDHEHEAEQARRALLHAGFSYAAVVVHSGALRTGSALDGQSTVQEDHGGVGGWFRSLFNINEDDADAGLYAEAARRGHFVLSVHVNDAGEAARAEQLLQQHGTIDLDARARQWRQEGSSGAEPATGAAAGSAAGASGEAPAPVAGSAAAGSAAADSAAAGLTAAGAGGDRTAGIPADQGAFGRDGTLHGAGSRATIPVVQETLQVGKRAVRRGGVRVQARLVQTPVQQTVRLRDERVLIERRATDRPATEADFAALQAGASIDLIETTEEAVVSKQARVVEEIALDRRVTEREQVVSDTVRHTHVQVERIDAAAAPAADAAAAAGGAAAPRTPGERLA